MDFQRSFCHLIILSLLCLQAKADGTGYVRFLDSPVRQYFRPFSLDVVSETNSMLLSEVGAAVSVLLGFAPPATLSAASSSKLNEVLMPNPFDKPRAVFMLDVRGVEDSQVMEQSVYAEFGGALSSRVIVGSTKADIQLPDEGEVSVVSLNEPLSFDSDVELTDKELSDFASFLGGTYVADALERMNGEFTIPLASGAHLSLHMSKKADREFIESLLSLVHNTRKAMDVHEDLSGSMRNPAELITGSFDGIKVLQEEYGSEGVTQKGLELLSASISKIFESLQTAHKGQIVGVILFSGTASQESETLLNVMFTSQRPARWLEETKGSSGQTIDVEVLLVRTILAWLTGIILLIATLMGIYSLMNMPLTKDTLLYSNVKLD
ncbi:Protein transport protein like [Actinidia chinensis var. chinensis]|uniref:Protein transport protein like n=1 Tax=Actinidia chinensis var. chinensis TaxID=1590841 RepID=A0A2R6S0B3_ACTCC|nr:Protein transport protein like [Actinidia chinensis var. chinensis]